MTTVNNNPHLLRASQELSEIHATKKYAKRDTNGKYLREIHLELVSVQTCEKESEISHVMRTTINIFVYL